MPHQPIHIQEPLPQVKTPPLWQNPKWPNIPNPSPSHPGQTEVSLSINAIGRMQLQHSGAEADRETMEIQEWVLDALLQLEDWAWLFNPDLSLDLSSHQQPIHSHQICHPDSSNHIYPNCPQYQCPYCRASTLGHPKRNCSVWLCALCRECEHIDIMCPFTAATRIPSPDGSIIGTGIWGSASSLQGGNITSKDPVEVYSILSLFPSSMYFFHASALQTS